MEPAKINTIVFDVDGTLLNSQHQLPSTTATAVRYLIENGIFVMLATGKTYTSTVATRAELGLKTIGVYCQGLVVCNGDGMIIEQRLLEPSIVADALDVMAKEDLDIVAYSGLKLLTTRTSAYTDLMGAYHEPLPIEVPKLEAEPINKIILMGPQQRVDLVRLQLENRWPERAQLVQAAPMMLEILPYGSSKGATVGRVLNQMGHSAENTIAFGDGENDIELLQWAGIGVAMGNASDNVKKAADVTTLDNDSDGIVTQLRKTTIVNQVRL